MVDSRLYRLTIPGTVFFVMFAGWLVADSSLGMSELANLLVIEKSTNFIATLVGGGLLGVLVGYICGEIGLALKIPDPNIRILGVRSEIASNSCRCRCKSKWLAVCIGLVLSAAICILQLIPIAWPQADLFEICCKLLDQLFFASANYYQFLVLLISCSCGYLCLRFLRLSIEIDPVVDERASRNLWLPLHIPAVIGSGHELDDYGLEALTLLSHGKIERLEGLQAYLTRAWGRVVIGSSAAIAVIISLQSYWTIRLIVFDTLKAPRIAPMFTCLILQILFVSVICLAIRVQQQHRVKLYLLLLNNPKWTTLNCGK